MGRDPNVSRRDYADGSPGLHGMVAKACKLPNVKEKELCTQDFKSETLFLREHYNFKMKIQKSESDSS